MSYEVTEDGVDYTRVLTQRVGGIARIAAEYWRILRARRTHKLIELGEPCPSC